MSEQLVREWCERHGATVTVSTRGYGTAIWVYLPDDLRFIEVSADLDEFTPDVAHRYVFGTNWESVYEDLTTSVYRRLT